MRAVDVNVNRWSVLLTFHDVAATSRTAVVLFLLRKPHGNGFTTEAFSECLLGNQLPQTDGLQ